jgi:O-methyltransferase involved in polyketide biosynthesis
VEVPVKDKIRVSLGEVQETLLVPLYGRATMTEQGSALITDPKAVEMIAAIDYDFTPFDGTMSLVGSVLRTRIHDYWVERWLAEHPTGTVVEIGAGLNTRYERLDNGQTRWIELDLPDVISLRRNFFDDTERRTMLAASITSDEWIEPVLASGGPWFFCAEAVLIYLQTEQVETILRTIAARFPGAVLSFDTWSAWMREHQEEHDTIGQLDAAFSWFCDDLANLAPRDVTLEVHDRVTFLEAPEAILDLLPPPLREALPSYAADPQMTAYHQNLVSISPRTSTLRPIADSPRV